MLIKPLLVLQPSLQTVSIFIKRKRREGERGDKKQIEHHILSRFDCSCRECGNYLNKYRLSRPKLPKPGFPSKKLKLSENRKVERERWLNRNFVLGSSRVYYNTTLEFHPGNKFLDVSSLDSSAPLIVLPPVGKQSRPVPYRMNRLPPGVAADLIN